MQMRLAKSGTEGRNSEFLEYKRGHGGKHRDAIVYDGGLGSESGYLNIIDLTLLESALHR